ncbi:phage tail protein [Conchiformibius kuhniae]|uniref:Phage tail protein n=1 Tax=Conchiformibius kuhniae TaxID=211502 RepID=A0A8T9MWW4_9NEIS|nr:phage tail protein [Conchiformibius kuhniae]UOP05345.1 phage tail protein [Conchiformibius kuhniae]
MAEKRKEIFRWRTASAEHAETVRFDVREVRLGDGYKQVQPKGINTRRRIWAESVMGSKATIDQIAAFFDRHEGVKSFIWAYNEAEVRVQEYERRTQGGIVWEISFKFEEV